MGFGMGSTDDTDSLSHFDHLPVISRGPFGLRLFLPVVVGKKANTLMAKYVEETRALKVRPSEEAAIVANRISYHCRDCADVEYHILAYNFAAAEGPLEGKEAVLLW